MTIPMLGSLRLKRFRSLPSATVDFDNPTFLVGQNGSGKSNVTDALAFLSDAMVLPLQTVFDRRGGFAVVGNRSSARGRPSNLGFRAALRNPDREPSQAVYALELQALRSHGFKVVREQCMVRRQDGSRDWFDRRPPDGFRSSLKSLDPALEESALALPLVGGDARFQPVHCFLSGMRAYRIEPSVLREMQDPDDGVRLRSDGSNAASVLREIKRRSPKDWPILLELLESIVPKTIDVGPKKHGNKLTLEFVQDWGTSENVKFEAWNMSDGALRTLGILAAVFQKPAPSVLVVEEPESTMHPGALGAILDLLRSASRKMQVIVTTHSPDVLDAEWLRDRHIRIIGWEKGATRADPVSKETRTALEEHLMSAGELFRANALAAEPVPSGPSPVLASLFEDELT